MLEKNRKEYEPEVFSRFSVSKPLIQKVESGTAAILIDLWQYSEKVQDAIINIVNSMPSIDYVLLATYGWNNSTFVRERRQGLYNISLRDKIDKPSIELVPYVDKIEDKHITSFDSEASIQNELKYFTTWFSFKKIIMMGGAYGLCLHNRPFGILNLSKYYAKNKIKTRIYIHPSAITLPNLSKDEYVEEDGMWEAKKAEEMVLKNVGPGDTALLKKFMRMSLEEKKEVYSSLDGYLISAHLNYKVLDRADDWSPAEIDNHPVFLYKTLPERKKTII